MRRLSLTLLIGAAVLFVAFQVTESPHGEDLQIDCSVCHSPDGWKLDKEHYAFDHGTTEFPLTGQHQTFDCRKCHETLVFSEAEPECISCHTDMHEQTVGMNCGRCHTSQSWLVHNITEIHQLSRFPLTGPHITASCDDCHTSASSLRFEPLGVECYDCHEADYLSATSPNHVENDYSTDCLDCHVMYAFTWAGAGIDHSFFPLTQGHDLADCFRCHTEGTSYSNISRECISCHEEDFNTTTNPDHQEVGFSTECTDCHTTNPGWKPANFFEHDVQFFPVYSGSHSGEWNACTDCHTNPADYAIFSCIDCHEHNQAATDDEHDEVGGYIYESNACFECHPTGSGDNVFDHNSTAFPLTGAHTGTDCMSCHADGFEGTPTECYSCHEADFIESMNPAHDDLGLSQDCGECHTTMPGWQPATFDIHYQFYALIGAHANIANDCAACHEGNYNETPNTCVGCHQEDYNQTTDPPHETSGFSTECLDCHTQSEWQPSTFDHDGQYFPIYSGSHNGEWNACIDCHTQPTNYSIFTCTDCHEHNQPDTDEEHSDVGGYIYESMACFECHPTGESEGSFNHNNSAFPLTGAHVTTDCIDCHANGYQGTPTDCFACHEPDFNQSANPNHQELGLETTCGDCHTTQPGWEPATFDVHNNYYELVGAHATISNNCAECHNGNYNNTPNTCIGCHEEEYNQTSDPPHEASGFPTECLECHTQEAWQPATFEHDGQYFPIYSGSHQGTWNSCTECHSDPTNYAIFSCFECHSQPDMDEEHQEVGGYIYENAACYECHPTGESSGAFNHNTSGFPLTGGHAGTTCLECHENGYQNTPTDCFACHEPDFNQSSNPSHTDLSLSHDCENCHTTAPGWEPATFDVHNDYYELVGAHATISNNCAECHNGNYNNTPNTCIGCHEEDYNQTNDPPHEASGFPTECLECHTQEAWEPATFDHDGQYFPIYSGSHQGTWNSCSECHADPTNYSIFSCFGCHSQPDMDDEHDEVGGYIYENSACYECHPDGESNGSFNHNTSGFPLTGAHANTTCLDCHENGYQNTPTDCFACHEENFNQATNPNHTELGLSNDCENCHTTAQGWAPAAFDIHDDYYALIGAHASIANSCVECHNGDYNNTPNTCFGCHEEEYNQANDPPHEQSQFPTECELCHNQNAWEPSTFDHDALYFPIYSGEHNREWNTCSDCHTDPGNYAVFSCFQCHSQPEMDDEHDDVTGYEYNSIACLECHPNGNMPIRMDSRPIDNFIRD